MTKEEVKHVNWMYNRLTSVHKENPNYDYMIKFKEIIDKQQRIQLNEGKIEYDKIIKSKPMMVKKSILSL